MKTRSYFFVLCLSLILKNAVNAQICSNAANTVYGLSVSGDIYPITVSTAVVGPKITPSYSGNPPSSSNGVGYNPLNGQFYYFKRNPNSTPQEFVSFDPATNLISILASCPTTATINTGCASADGLGFYCTDANARLYYYSVASDSWTTITSSFYDLSGTDITPVFTSQTSGDMAIDGNGNLWILSSNNSNYGLFKIMAPLPTSPVTSITAQQVVAPTASTPTGINFAGIAFNQTGQIIMCTNRDNRLYRMETNLTLTFLGVFSTPGAGIDLTSCNFPLGILPISWQDFTAVIKDNNNVSLNWTVTNQGNNQGFYIENSHDGYHWQEIGYVPNMAIKNYSASYSFTSVNPANGTQYYRIRQVDISGRFSYSEVKIVSIKYNSQVSVWPNPSSDFIRIQNEYAGGNGSKAQLFDLSGRMVNEIVLENGINTVNISKLSRGTYIIKVQVLSGETFSQKLLKN